MSIFFSELAPNELPNMVYTGVPRELGEHALKAAQLMPGFEVTLMPIGTPEEALAAAQERAAYLQAKGNYEARERGAIFVMSTREEPTPEEYAEKIYARRAVTGLMRVKLAEGVELYDLLREYYEPETAADIQSDQPDTE